MKKVISFLIICMLLCVNVFAENNYTIINMSEFAKVGDFSEGLCAAQDNVSGRWGFVDVNKNWVISPQFQSASYFKNGLCAVNTVDGESVLINHNGEVVFKRSEYYDKVTSENFYLEKHGKFLMIWEDMNKYITRHWVTLVDENYNVITPNDVNLHSFITTKYESPEVSHTLFWESNKRAVYNYKGVNISQKLIDENVALTDDMIANNKYVIGRAEGKIKCFNIDGNKIAEFSDDTSDDVLLRDDMIICNNKVYNIPENRIVFNGYDMNVQEIDTYYNKYFTVKKKNGTTALYGKNGEALVDFGKWDYIFPLSATNEMVVSANRKCGLANFNGDLIIPMEYSMDNSYTAAGGKYAKLRKGTEGYVYVAPITHNSIFATSSYLYTGSKYNRIANYVLDSNLNIVYNDKSVNYNGIHDGIEAGFAKLTYSGNPTTYGFLICNDSGVKVKIDNSRLEFDVLPIIENGRTLVPMRAIFEALGADVEWDGETQMVTAKNKDVTIQMQIGNNTLTKNGQNSEMDVCPQLVDGRTMVPVRAVSDSFNVTVEWDGYTQTVSLFTN